MGEDWSEGEEEGAKQQTASPFIGGGRDQLLLLLQDWKQFDFNISMFCMIITSDHHLPKRGTNRRPPNMNVMPCIVFWESTIMMHRKTTHQS